MRQTSRISDGQGHWNSSRYWYLSQTNTNNQGITEYCCALPGCSEIKDGTGPQLMQVSPWMSFFLSLPAFHCFFYLLPSWCLQKHLSPAQLHFHSISALCCCPAFFLTVCCFLKDTLWVTVPLHFPSSYVETVGICVVSVLASKSARRRIHATTN